MDFYKVYEKEREKGEFGTNKVQITSRERIHLSLSTIENYATNLDLDHAMVRKFSEASRYIFAPEMTHELFVSVYNVNDTQACLLRFSVALPDAVIARVAHEVTKASKPNLEMRIIGGQNADTELMNGVDRLYKFISPNLMEVDLFGTETRNIAFDLKLGMSFNVLLLNRIYRPNELLNTLTKEDFNKKRSVLKFV